MTQSMNKAIWLLVTLLAGSTQAATITYDNRAPFEATLGSMVKDDYEKPGYSFVQSDAAMNAVLGETQYKSTGFSNIDVVFESTTGNHNYCAGCNGSYLMDFTATSVTTGSGVFGVGFDYFNFPEVPYHAFVTFGDGSAADISLTATTDYPALHFFGITSDLMIKTMHLGLAGGGTTMAGSMGQDNLTIGNAAAVPEPSVLALFSTSLVGICWNRRRRASR